MFSLKTLAVAGAMLVASVSGSFAAYLDHDAKLLTAPNKWAPVILYADAGDHVKIINCGFGNYCFVKLDGYKGYVKKSAIEFNNGPVFPGPGPYPYPSPVHACFWGPVGYVCIN